MTQSLIDFACDRLLAEKDGSLLFGEQAPRAVDLIRALLAEHDLLASVSLDHLLACESCLSDWQATHDRAEALCNDEDI